VRLSLATLVVLVVVWVVSEIAAPHVTRSRHTPTRGGSRDTVLSAGISKGSIRVGQYTLVGDGPVNEPPVSLREFLSSPKPSEVHEIRWSVGIDRFVWGETRKWTPQLLPIRYMVIPRWCLVAPIGAWFVVACLRRWRERLLCPCSYDPRGLDVCPECGREAQSTRARHKETTNEHQ
jgi:hypothetical protein